MKSCETTHTGNGYKITCPDGSSVERSGYDQRGSFTVSKGKRSRVLPFAQAMRPWLQAQSSSGSESDVVSKFVRDNL